jgi:hypothetical protein
MQGTYSDFKVIKSRKVIQVVIEIPIEQGNSFVGMFGVPNPSEEVWVAIAELDRRAMTGQRITREEEFEAAKAIKSAGILCKSEIFGGWLRDYREMDVDPNNHDSIARALRALLGVKSRADMRNIQEAVTAFNRLKGEYDAWFLDIESNDAVGD